MSTNPTYVIAEMACSHDGSVERAKKIIDCAGTSGADAIQFQVWKKEDIVTPDHPDLDILTKVELSHDNWEHLSDYVRKHYPSMDIIACIYELESLHFCNQIGVNAFKIHVADITNLHLLRAVGRTQKRVDLSTGACTIEEILAATKALQETGCPDIWLMYGLQNFPTPPEDIDLAYMINLAKITGLSVGYQDHSDPENPSAYALCTAAMGLGINIVEKHITHDRSYKGADHQAALNPDEFSAFMSLVRSTEKALSGGAIRPMTEAEQYYRSYARKSLVAARPINKGTVVCAEDFKILRANDFGLDPNTIDDQIGKLAVHDIVTNQVLFKEDFK